VTADALKARRPDQGGVQHRVRLHVEVVTELAPCARFLSRSNFVTLSPKLAEPHEPDAVHDSKLVISVPTCKCRYPAPSPPSAGESGLHPKFHGFAAMLEEVRVMHVLHTPKLSPDEVNREQHV